MTGPTTVRVGIVTYESADRIGACLDALPASLHDLAAEIMVVDNASRDDSAAIAAAHGVEVVRNDDNVGYARAMNQALADTQAEVLVALNPDTIPTPRSLRQLVDVLDARPDVAVAVPRLVHPDGRTQASAHRFPWLPAMAAALLVPRRLLSTSLKRRLTLPDTLGPGRAGPVDWAIGAVHVMRRSMVGDRPYGERWFMYVEDLDLCWRVSQAGHLTWYQGDVMIVHEGGASAQQVFGADPSARWWGETYDWYALTRGTGRCRMYALANALAAMRKTFRAHLGPDEPARWRAHARRHLRVVFRGPPGPAAPPDGVPLPDPPERCA